MMILNLTRGKTMNINIESENDAREVITSNFEMMKKVVNDMLFYNNLRDRLTSEEKDTILAISKVLFSKPLPSDES